MSNARASLFEADDNLDVSGFAPKKPELGATPAAAEEVRAVSEASSFRSREPVAGKQAAPVRPRREPRLYRTGRNVQFNVKARQETVDSFYEITDQQGWVLGETFERALEALKRELARQK
jgi:hypothetical protein